MGSRKKLVLASLVSLMMALAFVIGLMPLHASLRASAASGSGRVDMVDLLNAVLNFQAIEPATAIAVTWPPDEATVLTPANSIQTLITVQAEAEGDASPVAYAAWTPGLGTTFDLDEGTEAVFSDVAPFPAALDVTALLAPTETSLSIYAFANAALNAADESQLVYSVVSGPTDVTVLVVDQSADEDLNGIPRPLTTIIGAGGVWYAAYFDKETMSQVNVAIANLNLPQATKQMAGVGTTVVPEPGVLVTSPNFDLLLDAGLVVDGELAYLIVKSVSELEAAIDAVDGEDPEDIAGWADSVAAVEPSLGRVPLLAGGLSPYVEVSLLVVDTATDTYREIETLPDTIPVEIELQNLDLPESGQVQMWSYLSWIRDSAPGAEDFFFASVEAAEGVYEWQLVDSREEVFPGQAPTSYIADLTSLSIFAAYESAFTIYSIDPTTGPTGQVTPVEVFGQFNVVPGETVADLQDRLEIFFGTALAEITAIGATYGSIEVNAPASDTPQTVDVRVVDTTAQANEALLEDAFTYFGVYTVSVDVEPAGAGDAGVNDPQDTYLAGDVVSLFATANAGYEFVEWQGEADDLALLTTPVDEPDASLTIGGDDTSIELTALFESLIVIDQYYLTVNASPEDGGTVTQDPEGAGPFEPGTEVALTAIPNQGYVFGQWLGPVAEPTNPETSVTLTGPVANIVVTAVFVPVNYVLRVIVSPVEEAGSVAVDPDLETYEPEALVTLTATANPGWNFTSWVISGGDVLTANPVTIPMTGPVREIIVTAVFTQNPVLTILESEGGSVIYTPGISEQVVDGNIFVEYLSGTAVTLTAVPETDFAFILWETDIPDVDTESATITFNILSDATARAIFSSTNLAITDLSPDEAWFFGGVTARIEGTGFMPDSTQVTVFGTPVEPFAISSTEIWFVLPALPVPPAQQSLSVNVIVRNPPFSEDFSRTVPLLYNRYDTVGGVTTTAFQFVADDAPLDIPVALNSSLTQAGLNLPQPVENVELAYGLIRATTQPALIGADEVDAGTGSATVAASWNFAIHLYDPEVMATGLNTEDIGVAVYDEITEWNYPRTAASVPARLTFTTADADLDAADIRTGIMMWSIDSLYEYGQDNTDVVGTASDYQSTLTQNEVVPTVTPTTPAAATEVTSVTARLYDLTAFALKQGVPDLPAAILAGVRVDTTSGFATGPTTGGTQFTIVAPNGGLGWVTVGFATNITDTTPANATRLGTVIDNGATEFSVVVQSPAWSPNENRTVDVGIYLNSNLNEPVVVLDGGFRYTARRTFDIRRILLLLLGLGAALLGLAAGGDSGGDGGGPCFIATAAYGTPMAADIDTLRALRDTYLLDSTVGTAFVDAYYRMSPAVASVIAKSPVLAGMVRLMLLPVIVGAKCVMAMPVVSMLTLAVVAVLARIRRRGKASA